MFQVGESDVGRGGAIAHFLPITPIPRWGERVPFVVRCFTKIGQPKLLTKQLENLSLPEISAVKLGMLNSRERKLNGKFATPSTLPFR